MLLKQIAGYEIVAEVGQGAMATVYRARATDADNAAADDVAIKLLRPEYLNDLGLRARFEREGALIKALEHEAIVAVYAFGQFEGQLYIAMAYMPHGALSQRLLHTRLSIDEALNILTRVAAALDYAHSRGLVHRDLKPSNVLFNGRDEAFLADFGIAHEVQEAHSGAEAISGTPAYVSPEQARGEKTIGASSDIYALGVLAFQLLTGQLPFRAASPVAVLVQHMQESPPLTRSLNAALPEEVDRVLQRALAKEAGQRYKSAEVFVDALRRALGGAGAGEVAQMPAAPAEGAQEERGGAASIVQDAPSLPDPEAESVVPASSTGVWRRLAKGGEEALDGTRAIRRRLWARPRTAFVLVTLLAVVFACATVGALRGAELAAALRGETVPRADGPDASPAAIVYLPLTGAKGEPASPTATAAPTAATNMRLLVGTNVVTLLNIAESSVSLGGVTLRRVSGDGEVRATFGLDGLRRVAGNAIDALPPGDCLQVWRTEALVGRGPEKPGGCDTLRGWLATRNTNPLFQGLQEGDTFDLLRGEQQLVRCGLPEEDCAFFLTQE